MCEEPKMRVLHLCDSLNPAGVGGYESYLHYLSEELTRLEHTSCIVSQAQKRDSPARVRRKHYTIHFLPGNHLEARKWQFLALPESDRELAMPRLFHPADLEENVDALVPQLGQLIERFSPDVIHAHSTYVVFNRVLSRMVDSRSLGKTPLVLTIHGLPKPLVLPDGTRTTDYEQLERFCPFETVIAVSNTVLDSLEKFLRPRHGDLKLEKLYAGVDLRSFRPAARPVKRWDLAFLGRLEQTKGVDLFPDMLLQLRQRFPHLRMVLTGAGSYRDPLLKELSGKGVDDMVDYLGVVPATRVPSIINQSKIFIYASRQEPFGLSVVEAMACGIPPVTSNIHGPSEIVTDGRDGVTVTPGSLTELVTAVGNLLIDNSLRERLGLNALRTVETRFDMHEHARKLVSIYRSLLKK